MKSISIWMTKTGCSFLKTFMNMARKRGVSMYDGNPQIEKDSRDQKGRSG